MTQEVYYTQTLVYQTSVFRTVLVEYVPTFSCENETCPQSKLSSCTPLQHPLIHSCCCCYSFGSPVAAFRGGNHWKSLEKKQHRPRQTDRQLLLLVPHIKLHTQMRLICFFDGTKSEMKVIDCLPYQLLQTKVTIVNPPYHPSEIQPQALSCSKPPQHR